MKSRTLIGALALALAAGTIAFAQPGQDKPRTPGTPAQPDKAKQPSDKPKIPGQPSEEEMMDAMMKAGAPGENHKLLNTFAGNWSCAVKMWHAADAPAEESKGTATSKWIYGGRYLHQEFKGDFGGMPFEGSGVWGYDNVKKQFFTTWIDSMSTGHMLSTGKYDAASKTYTFQGTFSNPVTGKDEKARQVVKVIDDNKHVFEMHGNDMSNGKEFKMMEITYTRTGAAPAFPAGTGADAAGR
jgi:hypothetical protein